MTKKKIRNSATDFPFFACGVLLVLQEVLQFGVGLYALQFVGDNLPHLCTDTVVVLLNPNRSLGFPSVVWQ